MTKSSASIPDYISQKLSMEATFRNNDNADTYNYGCVTYDRTKLKGPQIGKIKNCNIQANGRVPITENELDKLVNKKGQSYDDLVRMLIEERNR
jgi:hypothetical protein